MSRFASGLNVLGEPSDLELSFLKFLDLEVTSGRGFSCLLDLRMTSNRVFSSLLDLELTSGQVFSTSK